jgi:hypothetical protein
VFIAGAGSAGLRFREFFAADRTIIGAATYTFARAGPSSRSRGKGQGE